MTGLVDLLARSIWTTLAAVLVLAAVAVGIGRQFEVTTAGSIGLYVVIWWIVLFAILPVRVRTQGEEGQVVHGSEPGAPSDPLLRHRAIWTSLVSTAAFAGASAVLPLAGL